MSSNSGHEQKTSNDCNCPSVFSCVCVMFNETMGYFHKREFVPSLTSPPPSKNQAIGSSVFVKSITNW